ncbi:MAG: hypothetical protein AB8H86_00980 [Polyangiales bacterium]
MRATISLVLSFLATACVSSSIEVVSEPDGGPPVDAGSPDAGRDARPPEDVGVDAPVEIECEEPSDCVLVAECCPECGPQYGDVVSISRHGSEAEPARPVTCDTLDCFFCSDDLPEPNLIPDCVENRCSFIDLGEPVDLNDCGLAAEGDNCVLRAAACCECDVEASFETLVSIADSQLELYEEHVCGEISCPPCEAPPLYRGFEAFCDDFGGTGQCIVLSLEE